MSDPVPLWRSLGVVSDTTWLGDGPPFVIVSLGTIGRDHSPSPRWGIRLVAPASRWLQGE